MGQLEHIGSGTTPWKSDTKRFLLVKRLLAINDANNLPTKGDTLRRLRIKLDQALAGITGTTA